MVEAFEFSLKPAGHAELEAAIKRAFADGVPRNDEQSNVTQRIASLYGHLQDYPRDVVLDALNGWVKKSKWQPNIHDLMEGMDWRVLQRRVKLEALINAPVVQHEQP
jgi:hypothetical protein